MRTSIYVAKSVYEYDGVRDSLSERAVQVELCVRGYGPRGTPIGLAKSNDGILTTAVIENWKRS